MFQWAQQTFDKLSQTVAPPPTDGAGRFAYSVQRGEETTAMGCIAEIDPVHTVINQAKGQYPIHLACHYSMERLIGLLLTQPGMNVQQTDLHGNTPLHYASMSQTANALDVVKSLISNYNASVLAKNAQGQTPYDVATMNSIRQYLLPIQLQAETQIALDNGGQGLPPGIDMGGLRINNPAMPPPPTYGGGPPGPTTPGQPTMANDPNGATAPTTHPGAQLFGTPSPTPFPQDSRIVSAPASAAASPTPPLPNGRQGYLRVGSSSAALDGVSKYRADGFSSSSSDVRLQKKYGHSTSAPPGGQRTPVAPPPSSGNSTGLAGAPTQVPIVNPPSSGGGPNPFAASGRYGGLPNRRYVTYGQVAAPAPSSYPVAASAVVAQPAAAPANFGMFNPGAATMAPAPAAASYGPASTPGPALATTPANTPAYGAPIANGAAPAPATPTTPFMPPPPYQSHNYSNVPGTQQLTASTQPQQDPYQRPDFASAAAPATASIETTAMTATATSVVGTTPGNSANMAEANAGDVFSAPSPQKEEPTAATAPDASASEAAAATQQSQDVSTGLPENWLETVDPSSGQVYYYNSVTNETSWERPGGAPAAAAPVAANTETLLENWVETVDPTSGQPYYYNTVTHETSWEKPLVATSTPSVDAPVQEVSAQPAESQPATEPAPSAKTITSDATAALVAESNSVSASDAFGAPAPAAATTTETPTADAITTTTEVSSEASATEAFGAPAPVTTATTMSETPALSSASDALGAPAPVTESTVANSTLPQMTASDAFAAPAPISQTSPTAPMSASNAFSAPPPATDAFAAPAHTPSDAVGGGMPTAHLGPRRRAMSADELFAESAPTDDESEESASPTDGNATDLNRTGSAAEQVFGAAPAAPMAPPDSVANQPENLDDVDGDGVMDDIPLSPTLQAPPAGSASSSTIPSVGPTAAALAATGLPDLAHAPAASDTSNSADSLFAAIGMPPPPFSASKKQ